MAIHLNQIFNRSVPSTELTLLLVTGTAHAQLTKEVPFITSPENVTLEVQSNVGVKRGDDVIDLG
ncbi:MAG: hypothetical protein Q7K57_34085 [Burkholderiaceae bacterium]|nr:hypothetical protein [Burkholderiaceae bacterium]